MLFKNVSRTLKKQYIQLFLLGVIITLSSFIYTAMDYGLGEIKGPAGVYFETSNQEDFAISMMDFMLEDDIVFATTNCSLTETVFTFSALKNLDSTCYYDLIDNRLTKITDSYEDISVELREYKDFYYDLAGESHKLRFLKENDTINLSYFLDGIAPENDSQIAIGKSYADNNNLEIGDKIEINNLEYSISGFVIFPDYALAILSYGMIFDNNTQTLALISDNAFDVFPTNVEFHIGGVYENGTSSKDFEKGFKDVYNDNADLDFITNVVLTENNMRSGGAYADIEGGQATGALLSIIISSIAILIAGIMVSKILQSQRGQIGILKSLGYKNSEITFPYIFFIAILSLPALILGYLIGFLAATPLKTIFLQFYLLPSGDVTQKASTFIISVIVPLSFIMFMGYFIIKRILSQKPVALLNPQVAAKTNFFTKIMSKYLRKLKITNKLQHLLLYRNIVKFFVFLIGMGFAAFLILLSFSMIGVMDRTIFDYYDNTDFNYVGYCEYDSVCDLPIVSQEEVIELPSVIFNGEEVSVVGLNIDSEIHELLDRKGNNITSQLEDGIIITKSLSLLKDFNVGDMVLIEAGDNTVSMEIVGITKEYTGEKAYMNIADLSQLLTSDTGYYNAIYSETPLNPDNYVLVVSTADIVNQSTSMQQIFNVVTSLMIIISILIGAIVVYILTVMTIEDNFYNISLFKVVGYNNKEIDKMIIGGYSIYGIIIFVLMMPIGYFTFILMQIYMAKYYNLLFPLEFKLWHGLLALVLYIVIFYFGAVIAKRKLAKVSLQEAMKMYQI